MSTHDDPPTGGEEGTSDILDGLLGAFEERGGADLPTVQAGPEVDPGASAGDMIGPYKLLQLIGEGGMGEVWMAERREGFEQKVAVKVIKVGMHTRDVVARFEAERQALALMDHPCIARVLDGGATEQGHPYFVMDLVHGSPITEYCDQAKLSTTERLKLFRQVCDAIAHAHQKGIIHRDIKPSNILVTNQDGKPLPKVIDFGIAKATAQKLTEKTLFTKYGQMIGTPTYMSPEQAQFSADDTDTRSDIYSLGVLLYELLTGSTPFDDQKLREKAFDEVCRIIREVDPPKPSTKLSTLGGRLATVATQHGTSGRELGKELRGELDWIVMRSMEKDRNRRYQSAGALGDDVRRYLRDDAVEACPPSRSYRLKKFARRNKGALAAMGAVTLSLVLGFGISAWKYFGEKEAREQAEEARKKAEVAERSASTVADFLSEMLDGVGPSVALGRDTTLLREILDRTVERMESELADQPEVEARLQMTIGEVNIELNEAALAEEMFRRALVLNRRVHDGDHLHTAEILDHLGWALGAQGKFEAARAAVDEGLAMRRRLLRPDHPDIASSLSTQATNLWREGRVAEAEEMNREVLRIRRAEFGEEHKLTGLTYNQLAIDLHYLGRLGEAEAMYRRSLEISRRHEEESPLVATTQSNLGVVLLHNGNPEAAEPELREALKLQKRMLPLDHFELEGMIKHLVVALRSQKKEEVVAKLLDERISELRREFPNDAGATVPAEILLFGHHIRSGKREEAMALLDRLVEQDPFFRSDRSMDAMGVAAHLVLLGENERHEALCREFLAAVEDTEVAVRPERAGKAILIKPDSPDSLVRKAAGSVERAIEMAPEGHWAEQWFQATLGLALMREGDYPTAEKRLDAATEDERKLLQAQALAARAMCRFRQGETARSKEDLARAEEALGELAAASNQEIAASSYSEITAWLLIREARELVAGAAVVEQEGNNKR